LVPRPEPALAVERLARLRDGEEHRHELAGDGADRLRLLAPVTISPNAAGAKKLAGVGVGSKSIGGAFFIIPVGGWSPGTFNPRTLVEDMKRFGREGVNAMTCASTGRKVCR
jgi:hypothetical protein